MKRAYYLADSSPLTVQTFPVSEQIDSAAPTREGLEISLQAPRGRRFIYRQGVRRHWDLKFVLTPEQLQFFEDLDTLVAGASVVFYFIEDVDASPWSIYPVRKETDFKPQPKNQLGMVGGIASRIYEYTLQLSEEIDTEFSILE